MLGANPKHTVVTIPFVIDKAINYKTEQRSLASNGYKNFIANHKLKIKKAIILFK